MKKKMSHSREMVMKASKMGSGMPMAKMPMMGKGNKAYCPKIQKLD